MRTKVLAHPLPAGMRDLLPEEARARRALAGRVLAHLELHGYHPVTPPAFEFAQTLERGLGTLDPAEVLRFVEPESGEVAALRPDMTPQIARMVATRLSGRPLPMRLCYEGTIVRRRQGGARRHRQVPQAGVELYGVGPGDGDLEALRLLASVLREVGLSRFVIDLGHASVARALLDALPAEMAPEVSDALVHKDVARLDALLRPVDAGSPSIAGALRALPDLAGEGSDAGQRALFGRAASALAGTPAEEPLRELRSLCHAALAPAPWAGGDLNGVLRIDLGEVRGFAYYTGVIFHVLAEGPGEPIAAGGRYDELLARFEAPMPAVGFAIHLDAVAWALRSAAVAEQREPRLLVASANGALELAALLRALGVPAAVHPASLDPLSYARAWGFTHLVTDVQTGSPAPRLALLDAASGDPCADAPPTDLALAARTFVDAVAPGRRTTDVQP